MMIFFLDADNNVYARYGGRDPSDPDARQSLDGLRYTMQSVLKAHKRDAADKAFAPKSGAEPKYLRAITKARETGQCLHCHQVKETLNDDLIKRGEWSRDRLWRYPIPENLGIELDVDRGNVVKTVQDKSAARDVGLMAGDLLEYLNGVPIHSFGDTTYALDIAGKKEAIDVSWKRGDQAMKGRLSLPEGWRKTDLAWRRSMGQVMASARLYGFDLSEEDKKKLGLDPKQLAFRQKKEVHAQGKKAGIQAGDIILGFDGQTLNLDVYEFLRYVQKNYVVGDQVRVDVIRDGKRMSFPMTFIP